MTCAEYCAAQSIPGTTAQALCLSDCERLGLAGPPPIDPYGPGPVYVPDDGVPVFQAEATAKPPCPWLIWALLAGTVYLIARQKGH